MYLILLHPLCSLRALFEWNGPAIDSPQTLVVIFGSTEFLDNPQPIIELGAAYKHSHFIGCSKRAITVANCRSGGSHQRLRRAPR